MAAYDDIAPAGSFDRWPAGMQAELAGFLPPAASLGNRLFAISLRGLQNALSVAARFRSSNPLTTMIGPLLGSSRRQNSGRVASRLR